MRFLLDRCVIVDAARSGHSPRLEAWLTAQEPQDFALSTVTLGELRLLADEVVCLEAVRDLGANGYYYRDVGPVSDDEVVAALAEVAPTGSPVRESKGPVN